MRVSDLDLARLRRDAAAADAAGVLGLRQRALLHRRRWLTLLAPAAVGGAELPLPAMVRLEEQLAEADGSVAWVVTLCAGASFFAGFLAPERARSILATPRACLGGSGAVAGTAERDGAGWRLHGEWTHASGAPLCTHVTLNAQLQVGGEPLRDRTGQPRVRAFVLPAAQVRVRDTWHAMGLRASSSHGFAVDGVWAAEDQAFDIQPDAATHGGPLYRFPFLPLAFATLAANVSGLAREYLRLAEAPLSRPRTRHLLDALAQAHGALEAVRADFYARLDAGWTEVDAGRSLADAEGLNAAARALVAEARAAVNRLHPLCGLQAADLREPLNRVWRDLHTATQHALWLPAAKMAA